jgi:hypothetical protein
MNENKKTLNVNRYNFCKNTGYPGEASASKLALEKTDRKKECQK